MQTSDLSWTHIALKSLTCLVVDDMAAYRSIVRKILQTQPHWQIVGEAADGMHALELVAVHQPNLVCLDINLPLLNGIEVTRQIKQIAPATRVLLISGYDDEEFQREALLAGAEALLRKEDVDSYSLIQRIAQLFADKEHDAE